MLDVLHTTLTKNFRYNWENALQNCWRLFILWQVGKNSGSLLSILTHKLLTKKRNPTQMDQVWYEFGDFPVDLWQPSNLRCCFMAQISRVKLPNGSRWLGIGWKWRFFELLCLHCRNRLRLQTWCLHNQWMSKRFAKNYKLLEYWRLLDISMH